MSKNKKSGKGIFADGKNLGNLAEKYIDERKRSLYELEHIAALCGGMSFRYMTVENAKKWSRDFSALTASNFLIDVTLNIPNRVKALSHADNESYDSCDKRFDLLFITREKQSKDEIIINTSQPKKQVAEANGNKEFVSAAVAFRARDIARLQCFNEYFTKHTENSTRSKMRELAREGLLVLEEMYNENPHTGPNNLV